MTLASVSLALWLATVAGIAGVVAGYRLRKAEEKRSS